MALDTLGTVVRIMGEHALEQPDVEPGSFSRLAEHWAEHLAGVAPPPGRAASASTGGRRDWQGLKDFVRSYCRDSSQHVQLVMGDLRQVIWVFIQNLNHALSESDDTDVRVKDQLARLEQLAQSAPTGELKREVLQTVVHVNRLVEERRQKAQKRVEDLGARVQSLGEELESARKESEVDGLTQLYNRRTFDTYFAQTVELSQAFGQNACLFLVDVDKFKIINDSHGHPAGDAVLVRLADTMSRLFLRKSDFVARFGGDELAVIIRETGQREGAVLGDRLLRTVRALRIEHNGKVIPVSVSVGMAAFCSGDTVASWCTRGDRALYDAKAAGRDRLVIANAPSSAMTVVPKEEGRRA
jgi:diguanylate cyclase (GGDEF)-like protein